MVGPPPASWDVTPEDAGAREIAGGLWRLRLPLPWDAIPHVNAYAMGHPDGGAILVDCGSAGDLTLWDALVAALRDAGFAVRDVRQVVLTHYHSDHAGVLSRLVEETGCEVLGHPAIEHFTDGKLQPELVTAARATRARREGTPEDVVSYCADVGEEVFGVLDPIPPTRAIRDGDSIPSALGTWTVIETPGHAPSHVALHQRDSGILMVGDLLAPAFFPFYDYGYTPDPVAEYFLSLERIEEIEDVALTIAGHGRPLPDLAESITFWRGEMRKAVEAVEREVAAGAETGWEVTTRLYDVTTPSKVEAVAGLGEVMAYLRHLRRHGRIVRRTLPDGTFRYAPAAGA